MSPLTARQRHSASDAGPTPNPSINLSGWSGIEDRMTTHDKAQMDDYADDIDTLLVFAALFSAILTTFVVQTYPLLQTENVDTSSQLLAYQISSQGNHSDMPPAIHSTITSLLAPAASSSPPMSARWINVLFFYSLVLSLAAALCGIMAKQWIREYLRWDSPLAAPRENVLVRQIRAEAWEAWNVETIIWSIPLLLETAMILFLVGITILLWTLDDVVAAAVTVLVAAFLGAVSAFTVLPIFVKRCPYKSPTAWIVVRLARIAGATVLRLVHRLQRARHRQPLFLNKFSTKLIHELRVPQTWRERDIDSCKVTNWYGQEWPWCSRMEFEAVKLEIVRESAHLKQDDSLDTNFEVEGEEWSGILPAVLKDIRETSILLRSLAWVRQAFHDVRVETYIDECMNSIHPEIEHNVPMRNTTPPVDPLQVRVISHWCIMASIRAGALAVPHLALSTQSLPNPHMDASIFTPRQLSVTDIRRLVGVQASTTSGGRALNLRSSRIPRIGKGLKHLNISLDLSSVGDVFHRLIASDLAFASREAPSLKWALDDTTVRRVFELFTVVYSRSNSVWVDSSFLGREAYLPALRDVLGLEHPTRLWTFTRAAELWPIVLEIACARAKLTVKDGLFEISEGRMTAADYESLLLSTALFGPEPLLWGKWHLDTFTIAVRRWLDRAVLASAPWETTVPILNAITQVVELSLNADSPSMFIEAIHFGTATRWKRDWLWLLQQQEAGWYEAGDGVCIGPFRKLLHALAMAYQQSPEGDPSWRTFLHVSLEDIHRVGEPCDVEACTWASHPRWCEPLECPALRRDFSFVHRESRNLPITVFSDTYQRDRERRIASTPGSTIANTDHRQTVLARLSSFLHPRRLGHLLLPVDEENAVDSNVDAVELSTRHSRVDGAARLPLDMQDVGEARPGLE